MKKLTILLAMASVVPLMTIGRASAQDAYGYDSYGGYAPHHEHHAEVGHHERAHADHWRAELLPTAARMADRSHRFARAMSQGHGWYSSHAPAIRVADAAARFHRLVAAHETRPRQALAAWRQLETTERQLAQTLRGERFLHSSYLHDNYFGFRAAYGDARLAVRDAVERHRYIVSAAPPVYRYEPAPYRPGDTYSRVPPRRRGTVRRVP